MRIAIAMMAALAAGCSDAGQVSPKATAPGGSLERTGSDPEGAGLRSRDGISEAGRLALRVLLETEEFTTAVLGKGMGRVPLPVEAFRILLREDEVSATAAFAHLLANGRAAGQLYGLCGLWFLDSAACERGCAELEGKGNNHTVTFVSGCETFLAMPVPQIVGHPAGAGPRPLDIRGGGWPKNLRGKDPR